MNKVFYILTIILFSAALAYAQTSSFTFQGKLNDGGTPANGTYQFQFKLYDANGNQVGNTLSDVPATVANGIFAVNLDFGADSFDGTARTIEIGVRLNNGAQNYTVLNPRQPLTSTPYAVKSLNANQANTALLANDATKLGNVPASQYVITTDTRMSDARTPTPFSTYYIQNGTSQQQSSSFNISGEGKANVFSATTQFNIGGNRVFHLSGSFNTFVGFESGNSITNGTSNSFFGIFAGRSTTTGNNNSFFGSYAGRDNNTGSENSFFGQGAGLKNTVGAGNSLFGYGAGLNNTTGANNTFVGFVAGQSNTVEDYNTFIGYRANGTSGITNSTAIGANAVVTTSNTMVLGTNLVTVQVPGNLTVANTFSANALNSATVYKIAGNRIFHLTGTDNTFVGFESGNSITTGNINAFFGKEAGKNTTTGFNNAFFGAYAGRANTNSNNNSFFGANAGLLNRNNSNSFFGSNAGASNDIGGRNAFFGASSGLSNTKGDRNSFFGASSGLNNTEGDGNSFFGFEAGQANISGKDNTFFGAGAGKSNVSVSGNVFFGTDAGKSNTSYYNTFLGTRAGEFNTTGSENLFIGWQTGITNTTGSENVFIGIAGYGNKTGNQNTFIGNLTNGTFENQYRNLAIGYNATVGARHDAAAIGVDAYANNIGTMVLGNSNMTVIAPGGIVNFNSSATRIDHPLDPENKYLTQAAVTSPDMMNVYNGNATTDANGEAVIKMPAYLDALNRDFRYQLTVIGQFAQAIVAEEIKENQFKIRSDKPNVKVSWQVTGIRQDPAANQKRVEPESLKSEDERGTYLNPAAYGKTELLERRKETKPAGTVTLDKK